MQRTGGLGMRVEQRDDGDTIVLALRRNRVSKRDGDEVTRLLGLVPGASEYRVTYGAVARSNREIAIQTRSIFEIMVELSARVQPPSEHVRKGYVSPMLVGEAGVDVPFRVLNGTSKECVVRTFLRRFVQGFRGKVGLKDRGNKYSGNRTPEKLTFSEKPPAGSTG